ncbi:MAG: hypothetical protein V4736_13230 [Bdellovibrionota bacterium]
MNLKAPKPGSILKTTFPRLWRYGFLLLIISLSTMFQNCSARSGFKTGTPNRFIANITSPFAIEAQNKARAVIERNCSSCHQTAISGTLTRILDTNHLVSKKFIVPGDLGKSPIYQYVTQNKMPPTGPLTSADKKAIGDWILLLGGVMPDTTPLPPADLTFNFQINIDPLPFLTRTAKIEYLLGSGLSTSTAKLYSERIYLGDYDFSLKIIPKIAWDTGEMQKWLEGVEPVCISTEFQQKFSWEQSPAFIRSALGRDANATDDLLIQDVNSLQIPEAEKFATLCMTVLTSLEFITK